MVGVAQQVVFAARAHHRGGAFAFQLALEHRAEPGEVLRQPGQLRLIKAAIDIGKVDELGVKAGQSQPLLTSAVQQFVEAKGGARGGATKDQHGWGHICGCEEGGIIVKSHFVDKVQQCHRRTTNHFGITSRPFSTTLEPPCAKRNAD